MIPQKPLHFQVEHQFDRKRLHLLSSLPPAVPTESHHSRDCNNKVVPKKDRCVLATVKAVPRIPGHSFHSILALELHVAAAVARVSVAHVDSTVVGHRRTGNGDRIGSGDIHRGNSRRRREKRRSLL